MDPLLMVALAVLACMALGAGCTALAVLDALKLGWRQAALCCLVPGYVFFHLARRSRSRWRWALLLGIALGLLVALLVAGFVLLAEMAPVPYPGLLAMAI